MTQSPPRGPLPERPTEPPAPPPVASGALPPLADSDEVHDGVVHHNRSGWVAASHPVGGRCPHCPRPKVRWHRVTVASTSPDGETLDRAVEGDDAWVAASLRALADQLDPPKPPRPTHRGDVTNDAAARLRKPGTVTSPGVVEVVMSGQQPSGGSIIDRALQADRERRRQGPSDPMSFR